jgi:hypothetical protein
MYVYVCVKDMSFDFYEKYSVFKLNYSSIAIETSLDCVSVATMFD